MSLTEHTPDPEFQPENAQNQSPEAQSPPQPVEDDHSHDHEEVDSDEHLEGTEDHHHEAEEEHHDLSSLSLEDLFKALQVAVVDPANKALRNKAEDVKGWILKHLDEERMEKLGAFVEQGGAEMDFHFVQPLRNQFNDLWKTYRQKRNQYFKEVKQNLEDNLSQKQALVEELKALLNKEESLQETINEFREIQNKWRQIGPVPRTHSDELWRTYHFHVENFYDYLRLNKDFRELDFKKNLELKQELVEKAHALLEVAESDLRKALKELNELHRQWKDIGPVDREHRESVWEAFQEATKAVYGKREAYFSDLKERSLQRLEEKKKVVEEALAAASQELKSHGEWQRAIKGMDQLFEKFKSIGRVNLPENDEVWEKFRGISKEFNHRKNAFYKELKNYQQKNLEKKRALLQRAHELKDSDAWRETAGELKRIQEEWKKIGQVPRQESDKIWNEFREACNHFFNRMKGNRKEQTEAQTQHLEVKKALLEEVKSYVPDAAQAQKSVDELKALIGKWRSIGSVPREAREIENDFDKVIDEKFSALRIDVKESALIRFENKVHSLAGDQRDLDREEMQLRRKLDDIRKEMMQLENNIQFLSASNKDNPIVAGVRKNIEKLSRQAELLEDKIKVLRRAGSDS